MDITIIKELPTEGFLKFRSDQLHHVRKTFNLEEPERIKEAIEILRNWLQKQDYFNKKDFSDGYFERLLILNKGSVERTKCCFDKLCTLRTIWPQYFTAIDIKSFENEFKSYYSVFLPDVTDDCARVFLLKLKSNHRLHADNVSLFIKHSIICAEKLAQNPFVHDWGPPNGMLKLSHIKYHFQSKCIAIEYIKIHDYQKTFIALLDARNGNVLDILAILNPTQLQQMVNLYMGGYGLRIQGIHLITESNAADLLVSLVKQVLSKKMANRLHVHRNENTLYDYVPKKILPADYGGDAAPLSEIIDNYHKELGSKEHQEYMKETQTITVDLSKKTKDSSTDDYMSGSFRTLCLD